MQILLSKLHSSMQIVTGSRLFTVIVSFSNSRGINQSADIIKQVAFISANGYRFVSLYGYTITFLNSRGINLSASIIK